MNFSLIPNYSFKVLTDISAEFLKEHDIKLLMLDMDNTIAPYGVSSPSEEMQNYIADIKANGIEPFIVSNSKRPGRTEKFAEALGVGFIKAARKPKPHALNKVMLIKGLDPSNCALVGDQIFTDTIAANRADVLSLIVYPIKFTNVFLRIRYWAEIPFRSMCKNKTEE